VFAVSGGLPLPKRAPQRQAYRMMELKRWRDLLGVKLNLEPKFFPANELPAARCVIALREQGRMGDAIKLAHAVLHALWAEEKNTGDPATLKAIIAGCGLDADAVIRAGEAPAMADKRDAYTRHAIAQGVFGAPSFVIDGEIFWGQDRLDFVDRKLAS
jgi:carboxymethylenebutenolidase